MNDFIELKKFLNELSEIIAEETLKINMHNLGIAPIDDVDEETVDVYVRIAETLKKFENNVILDIETGGTYAIYDKSKEERYRGADLFEWARQRDKLQR